ncbi:potassium channel family protein [Desulfosarcina ovata]|uniref:Potassium transporter TrkA n=2 Tax=Desulfosarcina ovata TaxID=83564 RepID=A0A5K8AHX1_9BACT|nr:potassium channel protein [Desulfosarcina ovata]BBO85382.1 potassium transporter TrkA [Desulfosarcina ovata subsp. sediminis]BBO92285.1 potassium transporter TrkA [Desulfosarcina ovata subsp. ovata]
MGIRKRLFFAAASLVGTMLLGSTGYYFLFEGKSSYIDCLYMTVISLTTVGFGEVLGITGNVRAQIFTMLLITFGMGIILYCISTLTAMLIEGELTGMLRRRKMQNKINALTGHYIICGGGETGFPLASELITSKVKVVMIENDRAAVERIHQIKGLFHIDGDATEDANLIAAGIERAMGVAICLPSDNDNLYITMTARMLNPRVRIISRMTNSRLEAKLLKAGATSVVSPNTIGALRMASEMIRPAAIEFLDNFLRSERGGLRIHQIPVNTHSPLTGKSIMQSGLRDQFNLLLLGVQRKDGEFEFRPPSSFVLESGMTLIVMGDIDNINSAKDML